MTVKDDQNNIIKITDNMVNGLLSNDYFDALAPLFFHLNINGESYIKQFQFSYMKYIYENIDSRKSYIRSHTRFGRRIVDGFYKDIKCEQLIKRTKKSDIFNKLVYEVRYSCKNSDTNSIPIDGENSFGTIFDESKLNDKNLTKLSVLSFLENVGCVRCSDNRVYYIGMIDHKFRTSKDDIKRQFTNLINEYVASTLHNINPENEENKFVSRRLSTMKVDNDLIEPLLKTINKLAIEFRHKIVDELEKAEKRSSGGQQNFVVGLHLLSFLINQRE